MSVTDKRLVELALEALEEKRRAIDAEIAQLRGRASGSAGSKAAPVATEAPARRKRGPRKMSAAQKKLISEKLKKIWAERKKAKK